MTSPVVLNTRPAEQAADLSRRLAAAGFEVVEAPAIGTLPAWDQAAIERVRGELHVGTFAWIVLASSNAGRGLEAELPNARVICGTATASALGIMADITLERFSAMAAVDALRGRIDAGQRILVPRAAEGRDELVSGIAALGATVEAPVAYRTVALDDASARLRRGGIDVITLCSPSAVASVASAVSTEIVVCLGETSAAAARERGLHVAAVAASTSMLSLVEAVRASLGARV